MATLPDEFACYADTGYVLEGMPIEKDGEIVKEGSITFESGDKCGIQQNTAFYALKDLVVKLYEEIQVLKTEISGLKK